MGKTMKTATLQSDSGLFLCVRQGQLHADEMTADEAASNPDCHFTWDDSSSPFSLTTADGWYITQVQQGGVWFAFAVQGVSYTQFTALHQSNCIQFFTESSYFLSTGFKPVAATFTPICPICGTFTPRYIDD